MSRSGYSDDHENWDLIRWRGAVASAVRGKRGQAMLREILEALDFLPQKRLIAWDIEKDGEVCVLGAVGLRRGLVMEDIDPEDHDAMASVFGIAHAMTCEIMFENDEAGRHNETPDRRYERVRQWVSSNLKSGSAP